MVVMGRLAVESVKYGERRKYRYPLSKDVFQKEPTLKQKEKRIEKLFEDNDEDEVERAVKKQRKKFV